MSQEVNLSELIKDHRLDNMASFCLIHALAEYQKARGGWDKLPPELTQERDGGTFNSSNVKVDFKINGVEMDFIEFMERLGNGRQEYIAKRAEDMVREKFGATIQRIDDVARDAISKFREDLGIPEKRE